MFEVSLGSSWPKDPPRCEASGFPEPAGPEIPKNRKNVFDKYFLHPRNIVLSKNLFQICNISRATEWKTCTSTINNDLMGNKGLSGLLILYYVINLTLKLGLNFMDGGSTVDRTTSFSFSHSTTVVRTGFML